MASNPLAVLIDADNASPRIIAGLLAEVANYGTANVKRIYGDWTGSNLKGWKECLLEHSIQPIQQFAYTTGKNATDGAMIIDAMDLLYTGRFSGFCIVSSDCDKFVYVDVLNAVGEKTVQAVGVAVDGAKSAEAVAAAPRAAPAKSATVKTPLDQSALDMLTKAVTASADEDGRANLARVGDHLAKQSPDFDARNFGYPRLSDLVEASGIVEIERVGDHPKVAMVYLRADAKSEAEPQES